MTKGSHPNISLLEKLDIRNLDECKNIISDNFTWHYFNPELSELEGDYHGIKEFNDFFLKLAEIVKGSFKMNVIDSRPAGDELVVTHTCNSLTKDDKHIEFDVVVVWRIVNGKITEGWDIPAVNSVRNVNVD